MARLVPCALVLVSMACSGSGASEGDDVPADTDSAETGTDSTGTDSTATDTNTGTVVTDTDTDTGTDGCGATLPSILSTDTTSYDGGKEHPTGVEAVLTLDDPDGDLHEMQVFAWADTVVDGFVDTSGDPTHSSVYDFTGSPIYYVPCQIDELTLTVSIRNSDGLVGGITNEVAWVVVDAAGNQSESFVATVCPRLDDGTTVPCTGS